MDIPERFSWRSHSVGRARLAILLLMLVAVTKIYSQDHELITQHHFQLGEELTFSVNYGPFHVANAVFYIDPVYWQIEGRLHYYVQFTIKPSGIFNLFTSFSLCMESWVDAISLQPKTSVRQVFYNDRMDVRTDHFNYGDSISISTYVEDVNRHHTAQLHQGDTIVLDALSTYLYLRHAMVNLQESEEVNLKVYYTYDLYSFGIKFNRIEEQGLRRYELMFPETSAYEKGKSAFVLGANDREVLHPEIMVIELTFGKLRFELID